MRILVALLIATAMVYGACEISEAYVSTNPLCSDKIPFMDADVYSHEDFYVCVKINGTGVGDVVTAYAREIMQKQTTVVRDDGFVYLQGKAETEKHKVYYIELNVSQCEESIKLPIEIKDRCVQLPPSTIQAIPNSIEEGEDFVIEVSNADKDMDMEIMGLNMQLKSKIFKGGKWTRSFSSYSCCVLGERSTCSCVLRFVFTDHKHPICQNNNTEIEVRVYKKRGETTETPEDVSLGVLGILAIIIIGTALAVLTQ